MPGITKKMLEIDVAELATTIITHSELHYGVHNSVKKKSNLTKVGSLLEQLTILPFTEEASLIFAREKAKLKKSGKLIFLGAILVIGYRFAQSEAIKLANVGLVVSIKKLSTLLVIFLAGEIFHEGKIAKKLIASLVMIAGAILIVI